MTYPLVPNARAEDPDVDVPVARMPPWANTGRIVHGAFYPSNRGLRICVACEVWWAPEPDACWICGGAGMSLAKWFDDQDNPQRGAA